MAEPAVTPLVAVEHLSVRFPLAKKNPFSRKRSYVHAVDDVSFEIARGETLGIVGESGSGKSTTGRAVLLSTPATEGRIYYSGMDVTDYEGDERRQMRRYMQLVFQDPYASLNGRMKVLELVAEPLVVHGLAQTVQGAKDQVVRLLERVGLPADALNRYPHSFSGGQRQRIGIARALAISPEFIVADEPVSALDVSVRAQVINLFKDLQAELGLTFMFIAHDLAVVRHISHRIAVMYAGRIVEIGEREAIYDTPRHPYTRALLAAVLEPDPRLMRAQAAAREPTAAEAPNVVDPGIGCSFAPRCPLVTDRCRAETPALERAGPDQMVACFVATH